MVDSIRSAPPSASLQDSRILSRHNPMALSYIDKSGFFDNVNHTKLIKKLWHIGIRDR
jgi:hypothetical protein